MAKRLFDVILAGLGLTVLTLPMLVIAASIRLDSPGPAIFRQVRIGRVGVPFGILKFRTMRADGDSVDRIGHAAGITRLGALLRRTKLDELPQLWNVFVGDMSLVGPRPELPDWVARYPESDRSVVLSVRPGITDFASIRFRDEEALLKSAPDPTRLYEETILPRKLAYCRFYVRRRSICLDLFILMQTVLALVGFGHRR